MTEQQSAILCQMRRQANEKLCSALFRGDIEAARNIMCDYMNDPLRAELEQAETVGSAPAQM